MPAKYDDVILEAWCTLFELLRSAQQAFMWVSTVPRLHGISVQPTGACWQDLSSMPNLLAVYTC